MVSQMQNPAVQIKDLGAEEELDVVEATGSFKNKTFERSLAHTLGTESHPYPILKWAF